MIMTQQAMDANLSVNGLQITSESNELTEVARGVTINLNEATNGSTVNINVSRDPSAMVERVEGFIEAYNEFKDLNDELTDFDSDTEQGGLLIGDSALRQVENQVRGALTQLVDGMEDSSFRTLADIGIFTDRNDDFKLALDSQKLTQAFQTNIDDITQLFATQTQASDSLINYIAKSSNTEPGSREIFESDSFNLESNPVSFDLTLDGVGGANGTYGITLDEDLSNVLDTEGNVVEERDRNDMLSFINSKLNAAGLSGVVSASFNASNRLVFSTDAASGEEDRQRLEQRMSAREARLRSQFAFNDQIISRLNSTEDFLSQQFEIMNGMLANKN